jgi:Ca2+-binding RTX toxin-like protein
MTATPLPGRNVVDPDQTLHLTLQGVTGLDDLAIYTEDGASLHPNEGSVDFTVVDAVYEHIGSLDVDAVGKEIVHVTTGGETGGMHDGSEHVQGQIIFGSDGHDIIYVSQGNDILIGGAGPDTYVWNNHNMGHTEQSLDIIQDFTKDDTLRFDDLLTEHHDSEAALGTLLTSESTTWTLNDLGTGGIFHASDGSTTIELSVSETVSTLTVSYQQGDETYTQNVQLQNFGMGQIIQEGELDQSAIADMLQAIIQVGGNT